MARRAAAFLPGIAVAQGAIHVNHARLEECSDSYMWISLDCRAKYFKARADPLDCLTIVLTRTPRTVKSDGGWSPSRITITAPAGLWHVTYIDAGRYSVDIGLHRTPTGLPPLRKLLWFDASHEGATP